MMALNIAFFADLLVQSVKRPREAAQRVIALDLPVPLLGQAAVAVAAASAVLSWFATVFFPVPVETPWMALTASPLRMALVQLAGMLLVAGVMTGLGRVFGGKGRYAQALALAVWIDAALLCVQAAQVVLMLLFPLFASALGLVAFVLFLRMTTLFTAALHDFQSGFLVFLGVTATFLMAVLVVAILLGMLGLVPAAGA
ncbi:MAG: Yip1 family protein [Phaeovulum sp.]|uniref:Yip1 family protein n=1 Tax=Phaeovulum sp. TaxID=2934796 RepID=UPI00272F815F|nr:Yip1 family protein [Phaeovulum sp.]MDP2063253.1 Yip1 family protein [Phaeovulum sp.]MDP3862740.1 Yip1 family protein [Phaeovulum sp.]